MSVETLVIDAKHALFLKDLGRFSTDADRHLVVARGRKVGIVGPVRAVLPTSDQTD